MQGKLNETKITPNLIDYKFRAKCNDISNESTIIGPDVQTQI